MKPDSVKCILASYITAKRDSSKFDVLDGLPHVSQNWSGESVGDYDDRRRDFLFGLAQGEPVPLVVPQYRGLNHDQEQLARRIGRQLSNISDEFEPDHVQANGNQASAIGSKLIQFQQMCMFVPVDGNSISIPVVRKGATDGTATIAWRTRDKTAKAGVHYYSSRGNISFAAGDREKSIEVELVKNQRETDVSFMVELWDPEGVSIGSVNPLTVYIVDHSKFNDNERLVIQSITNCGPNISVSYIASCLSDRLSERTFKAGLQYLCSSATTIPTELAFASELLRLSIRPDLAHSLTNIVCDFLRDLPEIEDIVAFFS